MLNLIICAVVVVGICAFIVKYQTILLKIIYRTQECPLRHKKIVVVNTVEECQQIVDQLKSECADLNVLGFDCEWDTDWSSRHPVALIQLASHSGLCALIRLNLLKGVPESLQELLEDEKIIKVGVATFFDAAFLATDYKVKVNGTLDLRFMAVMAQTEPNGLSKLAKEHINVELPNDWEIGTSDWETVELSEEQREKAAKNAFAAVEIFRALAQKIDPDAEDRVVETALLRCSGHVNDCFRRELDFFELNSDRSLLGMPRAIEY